MPSLIKNIDDIFAAWFSLFQTSTEQDCRRRAEDYHVFFATTPTDFFKLAFLPGDFCE